MEEEVENPEYIVVQYVEKEDMDKTASSFAEHMFTDVYQDENNFGIHFAKLEDQNQKMVKLGKYDPNKEHLVVYPGLNLKAKCFNPNCSAAKHPHNTSWIKKGMGTFDIGKEMSKNVCKSCKQKIPAKNVTSIGFSKARLIINGNMDDQNGEEVDIQDKIIEEKQGHLIYWQDYDKDMTVWRSLTITAQKL